MPVFKLCIKIVRQNIPMMLVYLAIFLGLSLLLASTSSSGGMMDFSPEQVKTAFLSEETSPLVSGLEKALAGAADFVQIQDDREALQDALFAGELAYVLRVPQGYTRAFMAGENIPLEKTALPNETTVRYMDMAIEQYLGIAGLYAALLPGLDEESLVQYTLANLSIETEVLLSREIDTNNSGAAFSKALFNYLGYGLFSVLILGISSIMLVLNKQELRLRNACAPISSRSLHLQMFAGAGVFTLICWIIMAGFSGVFQQGEVQGTAMLLFLANSLLLAFWGASFSFFIGQVTKSRSAISAIANVAALGSSFIGGVFVPQQLLGAGVLQAASFTPTYWFVRANEGIADLGSFSLASMSEIFGSMGMQLAFGLAFLGLALAAGKRKRMAG